METGPAGSSRRTRWVLRAQGTVIGIALMLVVAVVHYWPGVSGWATYVGYKAHVFEAPRPGNYPLASPRNDIPGLKNFAQVSRNLYRAAAADKVGYLQLKAYGVRTIVDLRQAHTDRLHLKGLGFNYVWLPTNPAKIDDDEVADFLHLARNPDLQPLLVHCAAGSDRTGTMVAVYRVMEQGWPVEQAAQELPRFGFHQVWVPLQQYLKTMNREQINALAATRPLPPVMYIQ